jgi:PKD repeat protein
MNLKFLIKQGPMLALLAGILTFSACKYDVKSLGPTPKASFTATPIAGQFNRYLLTSTSTNSFRWDWDKNGAGYKNGLQIDTIYYPDAGTYTVKLLVYGQSGIDSAAQQITVAQDDPAALTPFKILTGNSSKKWKLAPEAGALWIGPPDYSATWWQNAMADVTTRSCLFNDEYTFTKNGKVMTFDSKNDFWVDDEAGQPYPAGMPPVGCYASSSIPTQFQAWSTSATFSFDVINNNKLKVVGTGAHLGLYKAGDPPNNLVSTPQPSVTYEIISITSTRLVLRLNYGWGAWKFIYVPA